MSTKRHALVAGAAAVLLAAGTATVITVTGQGSASGAKKYKKLGKSKKYN